MLFAGTVKSGDGKHLLEDIPETGFEVIEGEVSMQPFREAAIFAKPGWGIDSLMWQSRRWGANARFRLDIHLAVQIFWFPSLFSIPQSKSKSKSKSRGSRSYAVHHANAHAPRQ